MQVSLQLAAAITSMSTARGPGPPWLTICENLRFPVPNLTRRGQKGKKRGGYVSWSDRHVLELLNKIAKDGPG